jgi:hypothetical protein
MGSSTSRISEDELLNAMPAGRPREKSDIFDYMLVFPVVGAAHTEVDCCSLAACGCGSVDDDVEYITFKTARQELVEDSIMAAHRKAVEKMFTEQWATRFESQNDYSELRVRARFFCSARIAFLLLQCSVPLLVRDWCDMCHRFLVHSNHSFRLSQGVDVGRWRNLAREIIVHVLKTVCHLTVAVSPSRDEDELLCLMRASDEALALEAARIKYKLAFRKEIDPGLAFWQDEREREKDATDLDQSEAERMLGDLAKVLYPNTCPPTVPSSWREMQRATNTPEHCLHKVYVKCAVLQCPGEGLFESPTRSLADSLASPGARGGGGAGGE